MLLNKRFIVNQLEQRPYLVLKWAQTRDGFLAAPEGGPLRISNSIANLWVHQWRAEEHGILVGSTTVVKDNPQLTVRWIEGTNPVRIVLDPELTLKSHFKIFQPEAPTWIINRVKEEQTKSTVQYLLWNDQEQSLQELLKILHQKGLGSILVEGGLHTLSAFIKEGLWDEYRVIVGAFDLHEGLASPMLPTTPIDTLSIANNKILFGLRILF